VISNFVCGGEYFSHSLGDELPKAPKTDLAKALQTMKLQNTANYISYVCFHKIE